MMACSCFTLKDNKLSFADIDEMFGSGTMSRSVSVVTSSLCSSLPLRWLKMIGDLCCNIQDDSDIVRLQSVIQVESCPTFSTQHKVLAMRYQISGIVDRFLILYMVSSQSCSLTINNTSNSMTPPSTLTIHITDRNSWLSML